jgi:hypothetical protein
MVWASWGDVFKTTVCLIERRSPHEELYYTKMLAIH